MAHPVGAMIINLSLHINASNVNVNIIFLLPRPTKNSYWINRNLFALTLSPLIYGVIY